MSTTMTMTDAPATDTAPPVAGVAPGSLPCRLVIFDFDGTLSDSGDWFLSIADELADRFNFKHVTDDEVEALRGQTTMQVLRYLGIPRWKLPRIARYVQRRFGEEAAKIALFPGVPEMLARLKDAGVRIVVCTSNNESNARAVLGPANVAQIEWFEAGASLFGKARKFRRILRKFDTRPQDALSIGDETRDIVAARKVGVRCGAVLWGYANPAILGAMEPEAMFHHPDEIIAAILGTSAA